MTHSFLLPFVWTIILIAASGELTAQGFAPASGLRFTENRGQVIDTRGSLRPDIRYTVESPEGTLVFRTSGISYVFTADTFRSERPAQGGMMLARPNPSDTDRTRSCYRMDLEFVGANPQPAITAEEQTSDYANFYLPHCPEGVVGVRSCHRITYHDIYPDIDLVFYASERGMKYDFLVRPGGRVSDIRLRYVGADSILGTPNGGLRIVTPRGTVQEGNPVSYQLPPGGSSGIGSWNMPADTSARESVASRYERAGGGVGFHVGPYDSARTLIIDPTLSWATYVGGGRLDYIWSGYNSYLTSGRALAVDADGNVLAVGITSSSTFPATPGTQYPVRVTSGVFIVKSNSIGRRLWVTFYGGGGQDYGTSIACDSSSNVIVTGYTFSSDFPVSSGALQTTQGGLCDAFVVKLAPAGTRVWGTYFGGTGTEYWTEVAIDTGGNVVISGSTNGSMPISSGAFQSTYGGGETDVYVAKLTPGGSLLWCTYCGGSGNDSYISSLCTDRNAGIYLCGGTYSTNFPVTAGCYQGTNAGGYDGYLMKFSSTGSRLWGTYFGGGGWEWGTSVVADPDSSIYVAGYTNSTNLPVSSGAFQGSFRSGTANGSDGFLAKFTNSGLRRWATYCGGMATDWFSSVAIDGRRNVIAAGFTQSIDFPISSGAFQSLLLGRSDAVVVQFDSSGQRLWGTYFGGGDEDWGAVAVPLYSGIVLLGSTVSNDLPTTLGAAQTTYAGNADVFMAMFCDQHPTITVRGRTKLCPGETTELVASAGTTNATWSTGATGQSITVSGAGTYWVRGVVDGCLGYSQTVKVEVVPLPQRKIKVTGGLVLCEGDSVELSVDPGVSGYRWTTGETQRTIMVGKSGLYSVEFTDSNGCSNRSDSVVVRVNPRPAPVISVSGPRTFCDGDSVLLDAGEGYRWYQWSTGAISQTITVTESGNYWVEVANYAGCSAASDTVVILKRPLPIAAIVPLSPTVFCQGDSATFRGMPEGASGYRWSTGETTRTITVRTPQTLRLEVTDTNGCVGRDSVAVTVISTPHPQIASASIVWLCDGDSITFDAGPGYYYQWSNGSRSQRIVVRDSGRYSVRVEDPHGCAGGSDTVRVRLNPRPPVQINGPSAVCGGSLSSYTVPVAPGATYNWSVSGGSIAGGEGSTTLQVQWGTSGTGTVALMVTSDSGCATSSSMSVEVGAGLTPTVTASRSLRLCGSDSVTLDAGTGYVAYRWSTGETSRTITVRQAGSYSVWVHDASGCGGSSKPVVVSVNTPPVPAIVSSNGLQICDGDSTTLDAGGGYSRYLWSNGYTTQRMVVRQPGLFTVTVTDTNGCSGTSLPAEVRVTKATPPDITGPDEACRNSLVNYATPPVQGGTYTWSATGGIIISGQGTPSASVQWGTLPAGSVELEEWTVAGCRSRAVRPVKVGDRLVPTVTPAGPITLCVGSSMELDAGGGYRSYTWSTGETTQKIIVNAAGSYSVRVEDGGGCGGTSVPVDVSVQPGSSVTVAPAGPITICEGDSLELRASGGFTGYLWSNRATTQSIFVHSAGRYSVIATTASGCIATSQPVDVSVASRPATPAISANGDTLSTSPATGYQWLLDGGEIAGATGREYLAGTSGNYQVRVGDGTCTATSGPYVVVSQPVAWLDTASARVGDRFQLRMHLAPGLKQSDGVTGYSVRLRIDPKSLFIHSASNSFAKVTGAQPAVKYQTDGTVVIEYDSGTSAITGGELFWVDMEGLATGIPVNGVTLRSVVLKGLGKVPVAGDGLVLLSGCDIANGFGFGKRVRIESVSPNPAARQITVAYRAPVGSAPHLLFSNSAGGESLRADLPVGTGEVQESRVDVGALASGLYMLELRDREERSIAPVIITK